MSNFDKKTSKFKLLIYFKNGSPGKSFYSLENEEKKSDGKAMSGMIRRLLESRYRGKYSTALLYDNHSGRLIMKFIDGKKVNV